MLRFLFRYKFSIIVALIIALLSLLPVNSMPASSLFAIKALDKIGHFCLYTLFSFAALLESRRRQDCVPFHLLLLLSIFFLSGIIEVLQATVVVTRSAEWLDLLANFSGLVSGYVAFRLFRMIRS
jgi:VanZ family protein